MLFLFVCDVAFNVLLSKLELVNDEFKVIDLFRFRSFDAKKNGYWGYYWTVHGRSRHFGLFEKA